jgi:hypothetical protein
MRRWLAGESFVAVYVLEPLARQNECMSITSLHFSTASTPPEASMSDHCGYVRSLSAHVSIEWDNRCKNAAKKMTSMRL